MVSNSGSLYARSALFSGNKKIGVKLFPRPISIRALDFEYEEIRVHAKKHRMVTHCAYEIDDMLDNDAVAPIEMMQLNAVLFSELKKSIRTSPIS